MDYSLFIREGLCIVYNVHLKIFCISGVEMSSEALGMMYIFIARIFDVSIGTMRIILIARGKKYLAPILGFVEILIWLTAIGKALQNLNGVSSYLVYAGGFAAGNYVGMLIEEWLPFGHQAIRVVTRGKANDVIDDLKELGLGVTTFNGEGTENEVSLLYTVVPKKKVRDALAVIKKQHPLAFITVEDVKAIHAGYVGKKSFSELFGRMITKKK